MASGWNPWVWLPCIGVVSVCCCKEVYRYPRNNKLLLFPTPLLLYSSFLAAASLLLCSFFECFFGLVSVISFTIYSKRYSKNIRDRSKKSRSREYNYLIISIIKNVECASMACARVLRLPRARYRMTFN